MERIVIRIKADEPNLTELDIFTHTYMYIQDSHDFYQKEQTWNKKTAKPER